MKRILVLLVTVLSVIGCKEEPTMYTLTVSSNPTEGGTINPTSGEYQEGTEVTINVTPNSNYEFDKWSGSWSGSESPLTITMDSDKNIVGNFKLIDTDGDGVTDSIDQCNDTPSGQTVDENGCSDSQKDTDGDGVSDDVDQCNSTPNGQSVDENGCSDSQIDSDGDGVMDDMDTCPDTPSGENVDENGCSDSQKDTDGDGVSDDVDTCLDTPSGETVDSNGCSYSDLNPIYLDSNGVTIKSKPFGNIGDTGIINGITYTIVSEQQLRNMVNNNQDISNVCTSKVTRMNGLFQVIGVYNPTMVGDLSTWDVSNVTNMTDMFYNYTNSIGDISNWDVSSVTDMRGLFSGTSFNGDISNWGVSRVYYMSMMFKDSQFNRDISNWDVSNVIEMEGMFFNSQFNSDISDWDVSNVSIMTSMFDFSKFNSDISDWDVIRVTSMVYMFSNSNFNQDISSWNVSNVTDMRYMFGYNYSINVNLSYWDVSNTLYCNGFSIDTPQWTLPKPNFTNCTP